MDKYEQAVKEYLQNPIFEWTTQEMIEEEFMRFARYYEDKYLAEALAAAAMMRDKETCEWTYNENTGNWDTACEKEFVVKEFVVEANHPKDWDNFFCPNCGRRIVEKEEK